MRGQSYPLRLQFKHLYKGYGSDCNAKPSKGTIIGRVAIRHRPWFRVGKIDIHPKYMQRVYCADGYSYEKGVVALPPHV